MGGMVPVVLDAVDALPATSRPSVVNVSSLPATPGDVLAVLAGSSGDVLVVEDHFAKGGLTDEIARIVAGSPRRLVVREHLGHRLRSSRGPG